MSEFIDALTEDLLLATKVEQARVDAILQELADAAGFLSGPALRELLKRNLAEDEGEETIAALWRLVLGLHEVIHENEVDDEQRNELFKIVVESAKEADGFQEQTARQLLERLSGPFMAIRRQAKAIRMAKASGHQLSEFKFVCDLRPVFTPNSRDTIDGVIPLTTLTMETVDASGETKRNEVVLSYRELQTLIDEATIAQGKLNKLIELAENAKVTIPDMLMTRRPENNESEASDE